MKSPFERLYYRSPVALQNLAVSLYGWKLRRERYCSAARAHLRDLRASEKFDPTRMRELLDRRFVAVVGHALRTVPHWRDWARETGAKPEDFKGLEHLDQLPLLDKEQLRRAPERFLSDVYRGRRGLIRLGTSGTSGAPLTVVCDRESRSHHYAFFSRLRGWFGLTAASRRVTLFGRIIMPPEAKRPPFWRYDAAQRNLLMSSYHLATANLPAYVAKLRDFGPQEVIGYPSSIYQLARQVRDSGQPPLTPRVVFTTAETLLAHQREAIEAAFACPVIDQYGCTEMAFFASQCEHGTMHVHPEHGWLEALDAEDRRVPPGTRGAAVATGFLNPVMPLLRYRIGDLVAVDDKACACGRSFPVLQQLEGRIEDVLLTPDGRPLGRMDPIFKGRSGVIECQIVQTDPRTLVFRMVVGPDYGPDAETDLLREIRKRTGPEMDIQLVPVDAIPRGQSGKFKAVLREF